MNAQDLKNSILQLAVQGKLVEQRPEEGTAKELLEQIKAEKEKLIKEKKIKKEKPLPEITEDEIPFEIPESWEWVRLGDISTYAQTKRKISPNDITGDMWSLDLEDIEKDTGAIINKLCASERKISGDKVVFTKGNILYSKLRPYLLKILVAPDDGICSPELVPFDTYGKIYNEYVMWVLRAPHVNFTVNSVSYGVKMPRVGTETMVNLLIPLPPLEEQQRIVSKIEEILPYIDQYDKAYTKLETFNKKFPEDMKKSILQLAMQGKLVEQRTEEGTADELYEQIVAEKVRLVKEGKIKKEKTLPEIKKSEIPFDIPDSWKWVRVLDIAYLNSGNQYEEVESGLPYIKVSDMNIKENQYEIITSTRFASRENIGVIPVNSIIFPKRGGAIATNKKRVVKKTPIYVDSNTMGISIYLDVYFDFFKIWFDSIDLSRIQSGTAVPQINNKDIYPLVLPLPPLGEQKRIVAKIKEILPYCDQLIK